jgi:hypothetical protein
VANNSKAGEESQQEGEIVVYKEGIAPFWTKIPDFLRFPLHVGPLVVILSLAAVSALGAFYIAINGIAVYLFLRYAFSVMEQASNGDFRPDSPDLAVWGGKDHRPSKQAIVTLFYIALMYGLATVTMKPVPVPPKPAPVVSAPTAPASQQRSAQSKDDSEDDDEQATSASPQSAMDASDDEVDQPPPRMVLPSWFWLVAIICAIPLPASFMVIAVEDSLVRALNPLTTFQYLGAMGGGYFVLWLFFIPIVAVRMALGTLLPDMSMFVKLPIMFAIGSYLLLALFAMMGYCLYQYHQQLGYAVKVDFDQHRKAEARAAEAPGKPVDPLTKRINDFVDAGKFDDAIRVVHDELRFEKLNPDLNERLHKLYVQKGDNAQVVKQGPQYLKALLKAKRYPAALKAVSLLKSIDPAFEPEPDLLLGLAEAAYAGKDIAKATEYVKGFDKRFPGHADIPGVYLLGARITSEHARDNAKAIKILTVLLQRYPEAPVAADAKQYLDVLMKVAATKAPASA